MNNAKEKNGWEISNSRLLKHFYILSILQSSLLCMFIGMNIKNVCCPGLLLCIAVLMFWCGFVLIFDPSFIADCCSRFKCLFGDKCLLSRICRCGATADVNEQATGASGCVCDGGGDEKDRPEATEAGK